MVGSDVMYSTARSGLLIGQIQQPSNLIERKAEIARATNEAETIGITRSIRAIPSGSPLGLRQEASALVVADGFDVHTAAHGQGAN